MKNLHDTQKKLLELLKQNRDESWTIRAFQEELGISSTSVVFHHLQQLEKKGYIHRNPNNPSDYQILSDSNNSDFSYVNLYGMAQCGPDGLFLDGTPLESIPIAKKMLGFDPSLAFMVQARGDSMQPKINEGDYVVGMKSNLPNNGDIVVCVYEEKVLIKTYKVKDNEIFLCSLNEIYEPIHVTSNNLKIEGIVKRIVSSVL